MIKRLKIKFICITMSFITIMLVVILGLVTFFTSKNLEIENIQMMKGIASNPMLLNSPSAPPNHVRLPYFCLHFDHKGNFKSTSGGYYDLSDEKFIEDLLKKTSSTSEIGVIKDYNLRYYHFSTPKSNVIIYSDISSEISTINNLYKSCAFIGIISFISFLAISIILAKWAINPVDIAWKKQKQFIQDASHELKTPLAVILTNAELLQDTNYNQDSKKQFADNILTMTHKMKNLVSGLLELTKIENGFIKSTMTDIDFSSLVKKCTYPFEPILFENNKPLVTNIEDNIHVTGNFEYLQQVIDILLDNASKYSLAGNDIPLTLKKNGKQCLFSITSTGTPLTKEECTNIFERFYQTNEARNKDNSYGLGLAIAKDIIKEHNGKIWCESFENKNVFYIVLNMC